MGILFGFAPWIVYWVLVGNVPFSTAVLVALAIAVLSFVIGRVKRTPGRTFEIGAVGTFLVLTVLTFTLSQSFMERWMQPLSNAGIFLVALTGVLIGKPFVREFAEAEIDQLIYLATEHANREIGPGKEAYDIRIGSKGVPLVGDETRESWPSTYKVRERRH